MTMQDFFVKGSVCFETEDDVMAYWELLKTDFEVEHLGDLFANIIAKRNALIKKFNEGKQLFADKQYKEAGEAFGLIMFTVLHPPKNDLSMF